LIEVLEFLQAFIRIRVHGTQFQEIENFVASPYSFGNILDLPLGLEPNGQNGDQKQGGKDD
jgi:hypothetical protein